MDFLCNIRSQNIQVETIQVLTRDNQCMPKFYFFVVQVLNKVEDEEAEKAFKDDDPDTDDSEGMAM